MTTDRNIRLRRARPVIAVAVVAFAAGAIVGAHHGPSAGTRAADSFVSAWSRGDYTAMYADLDSAGRHSISADRFAVAYRRALRTATATGVRRAGRSRQRGDGRVEVPMLVTTRLWGKLRLDLVLSTVSEEGATRIQWSRSLVFPGMRPGERLHRRTYLPRRATLLARDNSVLAQSPSDEEGATASVEEARESPLGTAAEAVLGTVGPIPATRLTELEAQGVPSDAVVGVSGLELALDSRLRGRPGGDLLAGSRTLASTTAHAAPAVRTSVSPGLQQEAVSALGGQLGGIVAMKPSGEVLAVAGIGLDGLQPPGSTFKILTLTGVLQAHLATPRTVFPYATSATLDGVQLSNANGEDCGGSLELAFAVSCNSVFSPLGVKLGANRLVATAERFGFNHPPGPGGASESTLPQASEIQGELAVGSTAIGQDRVLATPLQMAVVAATIADGGHRPTPHFTLAPSAPGPLATTPQVARTVRHLMTEVVREGTGQSAAIPGVVVAGKTGTAELKDACPAGTTGEAGENSENGENGEQQESENEESENGCHNEESEASNTDAWFTAFAPARDPRIVVCVMLVKDGAGGDTAAPLAREVLETALH